MFSRIFQISTAAILFASTSMALADVRTLNIQVDNQLKKLIVFKLDYKVSVCGYLGQDKPIPQFEVEQELSEKIPLTFYTGDNCETSTFRFDISRKSMSSDKTDDTANKTASKSKNSLIGVTELTITNTGRFLGAGVRKDGKDIFFYDVNQEFVANDGEAVLVELDGSTMFTDRTDESLSHETIILKVVERKVTGAIPPEDAGSTEE